MGILFSAYVVSVPGTPSDDKYALRVPVRTLGKEPVTGLGGVGAVTVGAIDVRLDSDPPYLILTAYGFDTEQDALAFLPRAVLAFWHLSVRWNVAFTADFTQRRVVYPDDPVEAGANLEKSMKLPNEGPIHGIVEADGTCVVPTGKRIAMLSMGQMHASVATGAANAMPIIEAAVATAEASSLVQDEVLETAMNLYVGQFYEASIRARLLTLIMILETLAPVTEKHHVVHDLLVRWKAEIAAVRDKYQAGSDEDHALESLDRELDFRRETSIRQRVRAFVRDALHGHERQDELVSVAVKAYDQRGKLVHAGSLPPAELSEAHRQALTVVKEVLSQRLRLART